MKPELISHTPDVETLIATAMFNTTSGAEPSALCKRLNNNAPKIKTAIGRLELHHGSIIEHNRFTHGRISEVRERYRELLLKS